MGGPVKDAQSKTELHRLDGSHVPIAVHFWTAWCDACKQMDEVFSHLSIVFPNVQFLRVKAEEQPELLNAFSVSAVPYFVFLKDGKQVDYLEGADPSLLANKVANIAGSVRPADAAAPASSRMAASPTVLETIHELANQNSQGLSHALTKRLQQLVHAQPIMLFLKGTPAAPRCGFSQKVLHILKAEKVKFGYFNILDDTEVYEGLKKFSDWPTFPQLYCNGVLLGGCDIANVMHQSGELKGLFRDHVADQSGLATGSCEVPEVVNPGDDVAMLEMKRNGQQLEQGLSHLEELVKCLVGSSPVFLFMKGSPDAPRCGFSFKVVNALNEEGISFRSFDILLDEQVRQSLKVFSCWPTFPQLYYKGELIGGCDIVMELKNDGKLKSTLSG